MSLPFTPRNLDLLDTINIKEVWEHNGVIYNNANASIINEQISKKERVPSLLAAAVLGLNNTATPTFSTSKFETMWTDIDAQELYLRTKPTCYVILGKPGLGAYSLGEALSKKYNCMHLCPTNIISDEISQGSLSGKCLDFNMKHNVPCNHTTILKMLIQKLKSPAVKHRGYVLSGIPLVSAYKTSNILIESKYTEEALAITDQILFDVIYNLKRKKSKPQRTTSPTESSESSFKNLEEVEVEEEHIEEEHIELQGEDAEEEIVAELPKFVFNACLDVFRRRKLPFFNTQQAILLRQLQELFKLSLKPDIIIYISCPDSDVLTKKKHKFINYKTNQTVVEPFPAINTSDFRWPTRYTLSDYESPHNIHVFNPKYACRPPINFKTKSVVQICNYMHYIYPFIEKQFMNYDPNRVIKLDGRTSTYQMMHQIMEKLLLMRIHPVIIPEPLYLQEPPDDLDEFWNMIGELHIINSGVLKFGCYASPWFNRCPVELKNRQSVIGKPKLAVKFFKHIYLMSSLNNFISFCRNPRPFLKLKYLEPTCRIIVTGTRWSGKTMIAECLSWIFDTPVISYETFVKNEKQKKYDIFAKRILSEIIATIEDVRFMQWKIIEDNRLSGLHEWTAIVLRDLKKYIPLLTKILEFEKNKQVDTQKSEEITEEEEEQEETEQKMIEPEQKIIEPDPSLILLLNSLRQRLAFLPILDSIEECTAVLMDQTALLPYAPLELRTIIEKPKTPVLGDEDVTKAISEYIVLNDLQKDIDPTTEELMDEIIQLISGMDIRRRESSVTESYRKYIIDGFPSDPEYWECLSKGKSMPDYTIAIIENREIEPELVQHYRNIEKCIKNYHEILSSVKDPLIISKLQTKPLPINQIINNNMKIIIHDIINNSLESLVENENNEIPRDENTEFIKDFEESMEKFRENWDNIKIKLEDLSKCYIETELRDKTDVEVLEEVLLKLRESYYIKSEVIEGDEIEANDNDVSKDLLSDNDSQNLCETNIYCPLTYFKFGLLWEGNPEFSLKFNNKIHYFAKEEYIELFQEDITKYQAYNNPFKKMPKLKICVTGCIGSGKTSLSKQLATELGLLHVDFQNAINNHYMPQHYKKVGRMYENPFTDEPVEEEGVVEFQVDEENPVIYDDIVSNEVELRRMLFNYFERAQPVIPVYMQKIITKIWNDYPYIETGFVLDGYPRIPQDVEDMIQCNCIPDLVIALDCELDAILPRLSPVMYDQWKSQLAEAKRAHRMKVEKERNEWVLFITKRVVAGAILEDILASLDVENNDSRRLSVPSVIIDAHPSGSANVNPMVFNLYNKMIEEYPAPKDERQWQKSSEQLENINARLEAIQECDNEGMGSLKELLEENKIKLISVNSMKPFYRVYRLVLSQVTELRNRTAASLEQTFIVPTDIAELLLSQGYYFLSKFGRMCPVYIYCNPQTIRNNYKISRRQDKLFPVIHRAYIYFIGSEDNVVKFRTNPLKYITSDSIHTYYPYPLTIGIIGAPKSGKSVLAAKLAKRNNLLCISRGMALRYILNSMRWTELAFQILKKVEYGEPINSDCIMSAVQAVAIDHRAITYGFVFDGFPSTPCEAMALAKDGLYPNIMFDITSDKPVVLKNSQNEIYYDILKYKPPYSISFMENRFDRWNEQCYKIRKWINGDYQNICTLNGNESKWQCLQNANANIHQLEAKINYYLANYETNIVPAHSMLISNKTFEQNQSSFKNMCPACLRINVLRNSSYHGDKTSIVQYKNTFYWICADHLKLVSAYPDYYLLKEIDIPEIPAVVKMINTNNVYENGICVVTYATNLPRQILEPGSSKFAATYNSKTYMFCSKQCLHSFLDKPHVFSDITIFKGSSWFPRLSLKKLPDLGYLEQTLANILTEACCSVNAVRPKYPGLTFQLSGVIYLALYLKTHNPRLPKEMSDAFTKALKVFELRSNLILDLGLRMRSMENPFATYPKCQHGIHDRSSREDIISSPLFTPSSILKYSPFADND